MHYESPEGSTKRTHNTYSFLLRDAMLARYMPSSCVSVCVCLSVRHTPVLYQIIPYDSPVTLQFSDAKDHGEIRTESPPCWGDKCKLGELKSATFDKKLAITRKRYKVVA